MRQHLRILTVPLFLMLAGCASFGHAPPANPANACDIFEEKDDWYPAAHKAELRWGVPVALQLAIIKQESGFDATAKPPRRKFLGLIPTTRPSDAYGYGQALDSTWDWYQSETGHHFADRDDFGDVTDFIGWYCSVSYTRLGIAKTDAYNQYLAYHEGHGGWQRRTFTGKDWLIKVARRVETQAQTYSRQLGGCAAGLEDDDGWW